MKRLLAPACAALGAGALAVDSFLIDVPALLVTGAGIALLWERIWKPNGRSPRLPLLVGAGVVLLYWSVSTSLYLNLEWIEWMSRLCGAPSGRDWMINSGVFHFDIENAGAGTHVFAAAFLLTYPVWLVLGHRIGERLLRSPEGAESG